MRDRIDGLLYSAAFHMIGALVGVELFLQEWF